MPNFNFVITKPGGAQVQATGVTATAVQQAAHQALMANTTQEERIAGPIMVVVS